MNVLNIQSSPRGPESISIAVADAFLAAYGRQHPHVEIDTLNVFDAQLPEFDQQAIGAKYKNVSHEPMNAAESAFWTRVESLAARFKRADRLVIGVPMWNFAYPYKLKQLIDLVSQRNLLFTFDGQSFGPLLQTPRALVIYTRGQSYAPDSKGADCYTPAAIFDHQSAYIEFWLRFIGIRDVHALTVNSTWSPNAKIPDPLTTAKTTATEMATRF